MSHGVRADDEFLRGEQGDRRPADPDIYPRPSTGSGQAGRRPVYGGSEKFQTDPHWRDHILFYEYFHGDNGAGLGASHQTGWTGDVAKLIQLYGLLDAERFLEAGKGAAFVKGDSEEAKEAQK